MSVLNIPEKGIVIENFTEIKDFFKKRGVFCDKWITDIDIAEDADQECILKAYEPSLKPFMEKGGYTTADVISVNSATNGVEDLREKFIKEHTHTDDEVRFMVDGQGIFWFNLGGDDPVFSLVCKKGTIISVPANTKHWFDMGTTPYVKAIRIFKDEKGWEANYTNSGIEKEYVT